MAEKEYIERDRIVNFIETGLNDTDKVKAFGHDAVEILAEIHLAPAADVAPVVHAEWLAEEERTGNYSHCSRCGIRCQGYAPNYKYCPNCGAKMKGE